MLRSTKSGVSALSEKLPAPIQLVKAHSPLKDVDPYLPHILLVVDQFPASLGGGERVLLRLASLLPDHGFRVSILTFYIAPQSPVLHSEPPCPIYLLPLHRTWDWNAMKSAVALHRFLKQQDVRLVQTFFESSDLWAGTVAKTVPGMKLVWSRRDMGILRDSKHRIAYRLLANMPDRVFTVSEQVRRHCIEVDGIPAEKVLTIYNGVDVEVRDNAPKSFEPTGDEFVIACVGNIRHVKGHDILLEAAALVLKRFPKVSFVIAGEVLEQTYYEMLQRRVAELGLQERFHFAGGTNQLASWLAGAQMFVLPSRSEGFSNAIIEAMAAGLPVVATDVGGNAEAIEDGVTGFIVPSENPSRLANAICQLLSHPGTMASMGDRGKERVFRLFTTSSMSSSIACTYRNLFGQA